MDIEIKALTPELEGAYFNFFDHYAFTDGSPYYPCYCNAFNMSAGEIEMMRETARQYGGGPDGWKRSLRESASRMVKAGMIHGYLAFNRGIPVGWCNANDRMNYYRVGEFDLDNDLTDCEPSDCQQIGQIKSLVCFEISPDYRGKGLATRLLTRVCTDAEREGYRFVEAYPSAEAHQTPAFTGPLQLYVKAGFEEYRRDGLTIVMRKVLKSTMK